MKEKIYLIPVLLLACLFTHSQTPPEPIHGEVVDSVSNVALEEANISLYHMPGNELLAHIRSGRNGFILRPPAPGLYRLIVSFLGYGTDTLLITVRAEGRLNRSIRIRLQPSTQTLMQVVVRSRIPPVIVRSDTIVFNAGAYPNRPDATVEDLLRKMPGIEIDKDGNVAMQGQKVDKIYLDGKEFFLNDLKAATQNLPAELVAQIEAFDSQTEKGRLTGGKDNTGGKTLNIKLKKNKKQGYFGDAYAGAGNENAYSSGGKISSLGSPRVLFAQFNTNNINNQFTGTENRNGPGAGGIQSFTNARLHYRDEWGGKVEATFGGEVYHAHTFLAQTISRNTFLTDSSLQENRLTNSASDNSNSYINTYIEYKPDSFNTLVYRSNYSPQKSNSSSQDTAAIITARPGSSYLSNREQTDNINTTEGHNLYNSLDFSRKFAQKGRTLYFSLNESSQRQNQPAALFSLVDAFDSGGNGVQHSLVNQHSAQTIQGDGYGVTLGYTEPLGLRQVLDFSCEVNGLSNRSEKGSVDYDSATRKFDRPDSLTSNHFLSRNTVQRISAGYNTTEGRFRYQLGITGQFSSSINNNYTLGSRLVQHFTNWFPRASLIYTVSKEKNLNLYYSGYSTAPSIDQLQPILDLTNPFLIRLGNPGLQQQFDHNVSMNYTAFNERNSQNFQIYLQGHYTEHKIATATTLLTGGIQQIEYINVEGVYNINSNVVYGFPLGGPQKGNGSINAYGQYGKDLSVVNGQQEITRTFGGGGGLNLNYHLLQKLFIDGNANWAYSVAAYSLYPSQNTNSLVQNYFLDISYELPLSLTVSSNYTLQTVGSQAGLPAYQTGLWNAAVFKNLLRDHAIQLRLSAFDLLNTANSYTQILAQNYIETRKSNLPARLFLLSLVYHFSKFRTGA
jgi:hypothetical protein